MRQTARKPAPQNLGDDIPPVLSSCFGARLPHLLPTRWMDIPSAQRGSSHDAELILTQARAARTILPMPKYERHDRKIKRTFVGEDQAEPVLHWLNEPLEDNLWLSLSDLILSKIRFLEILRRLLRLRSQSVGGRKENFHRAVSELNLLLARYSSAPRIFGREVTRLGDRTEWALGQYVLGDTPIEETEAVLCAIHLAEQNKLEKLQLCSCKVWFFPKFRHQKFCSAACRVKFWENSEQRKAQKREKAREYYADQKGSRGR